MLDEIEKVIDPNTSFQKTSLGLRQQKVHAVQKGCSDFLDVARATFDEATSDVNDLIAQYVHNFQLPIKVTFYLFRIQILILIHSKSFNSPLESVIIVLCLLKNSMELIKYPLNSLISSKSGNRLSFQLLHWFPFGSTPLLGITFLVLFLDLPQRKNQ